jgi:hypothetical protein
MAEEASNSSPSLFHCSMQAFEDGVPQSAKAKRSERTVDCGKVGHPPRENSEDIVDSLTGQINIGQMAYVLDVIYRYTGIGGMKGKIKNLYTLKDV